MKRLDRYLDLYETASFVVLLSVMTIVVFIQVICRYILKASLPWSEEVSRYCMIYTVFIGVGAGLKAGTHTGVDALVMVFPPSIKWWVILIEKVLCFALSVIFLPFRRRLSYDCSKAGKSRLPCSYLLHLHTLPCHWVFWEGAYEVSRTSSYI